MPLLRRMHQQIRATNGDLVQCFVGADVSVRPAGYTRKIARFAANPHAVCRGRCRALPAWGISDFTIRCGKFAIAPRADRVVRPYRTFCVFADGGCNFAIASCRVDVGIDPYRDFARSPFVVRFSGCIPRGRGRTPPLRLDFDFAKTLSSA